MLYVDLVSQLWTVSSLPHLTAAAADRATKKPAKTTIKNFVIEKFDADNHLLSRTSYDDKGSRHSQSYFAASKVCGYEEVTSYSGRSRRCIAAKQRLPNNQLIYLYSEAEACEIYYDNHGNQLIRHDLDS